MQLDLKNSTAFLHFINMLEQVICYKIKSNNEEQLFTKRIIIMFLLKKKRFKRFNNLVYLLFCMSLRI